MFKDIWNDIFSPRSSFGERCLAALLLLLVPVLAGVVGVVGYIIVDSVALTPTKTAVTTIEVKQVVPAYMTTLIAGKVIIPQYHPQSYRVRFKIDGEDVSSVIEKDFFDTVSVGDKIEVDYGFGRLSNSHHPTRIKLVGR
jgi:hypothetical protein